MSIPEGRFTHPFFAGLRPTLHIAHRGGAALAPENTRTAFRMAVERYQTQMLELDVHATRDGAIVVAHDATLDRCTDAAGPIAEKTLEELSAIDAGYRFTPDGGRTFPYRDVGVRIPLLAEVLREFPELRFNIELKPDTPGLEDLLAEVIRGEGATARVCIGSESDETAERLVRALPEACSFYPRLALIDLVIKLKSGKSAIPDAPYQVLDMPLYYEGVRLIDAAFVELAATLGRWVNVWTIDDPEEMRRLIQEGVGGIMTDRPDLLREALDQAPRDA